MAANNYEGSCQCGAVAFTATLDLDNTITCNCSRCGRLGSILAFTPESGFTLKSGEDAMTEYQFNKHVIHHLFCTTCGIQSFSRATGPDGVPTVAVNVRCLEDVDPDALSPRRHDGKHD